MVTNQLPTGRAWWKFILLGIVTFGIYPLVVLCKISTEINTVAGPHDGQKTLHFIVVALLSALTLGILPLVWYHKLSNRVGAELKRRALACELSAKTFWGWAILGFLLFGVGPLVYVAKLLNAMNALNADYNAKG